MSSAETSAPQYSYIRTLRMFATVIALAAVALVCTAALPQRAYAYSRNSDGAIGKVTGKKYGNTYYGKSVEDVMHAVDDMVSTTHNPCHEDEVTIDLLADWNTKSYGRIVVPNGYTFRINLHGHMINRDKAMSYGDNKWYAEGSGEVIKVDGGTLYLNGGTGTNVDAHMHPATAVDDYCWKYDANGWWQFAIYGGLITGGACDDWHGAGGITLARDNSRAFITNTTIAGNITDQVDSSRYGHGAGIAVHGSKCVLELDNVTVTQNHAEGYGGGIYVRSTDCQLNIKNSVISSNYSGKDGGGIYLDSKATLNIENSTITRNYSSDDGGGIYVNGSGSVLNLVATEDGRVGISDNKAVNNGGGIYTDGSDTTVKMHRVDLQGNDAACSKGSSRDGGGLYVNGNKTTVDITNSAISSNLTHSGNGGAIYFYGNDGVLNVTDSSIWGNWAYNHYSSKAGCGAGIYHSGKSGKVTFKNSQLNGNEASLNGGGFYSSYAGTEFKFINSSIEGNTSKSNGAAAYFCDATKLILENSTIKKNTASGNGGGVYVGSSAPGSSIVLNNNGAICENKAKDTSGGGIYSDSGLTVSSDDATGAIKNNVAATNGGGIWFKDELALDNVAITDNTASKDGAGVYCVNTEYHAFTVARKVTIDNNKNNENQANNLFMRTNQTVCSADGDRKISADSKIGVAFEGFDGSRARRISGNELVLKTLGEKYSTVFTSDNGKYSITSDGKYVFVSTEESGKYSVTVKRGSNVKTLDGLVEKGKTFTLETSDYLNFDEWSYNDNAFQWQSKYSTIDYWLVTDRLGERKVAVEDGKAVVTMREGDTTVVPHVIQSAGSYGVQIKETALWDELNDTSTDTATVELVNYRNRQWSMYFRNHWDWGKYHSSGYYETYYDDSDPGSGPPVEVTEWVYYWWSDDPSKGTELIPKSTDYNYSFDHVLRGNDAASVATAKRTKVEDLIDEKTKKPCKKVTYQVTINKSYLSKDDVQASANNFGLLAFEGTVNGTDTNGLSSQRVNDQDGGTRHEPNYKTKVCDAEVDAEGNQILTFTVVFPALRPVVTFDTSGGDLPDGTSKTAVTDADGKLSTLPVPTYDGYVFDGWYICTKDGTETKVDASTVFSADTTVTAKWTREEDTARYRMVLYVTHEDDDDSVLDIAMARFEDSGVDTISIYKPADPVREGYDFGGWYTDEDCTDGKAFFNSMGKGTVQYSEDPLTLYAKWTKQPIADHTVTFTAEDTSYTTKTLTVADGETVSNAMIKKDGEKTSILVDNPEKSGYTFAGWLLDGAPYSLSTPVTSDITLTASWNKITLSVTYKTTDRVLDGSIDLLSADEAVALSADNESDAQAQDGSEDDEDTVITKVQVEKDGAAPNLEPTREGYRFDGWYTDPECKTAYDFENSKVEEDLTLYAKWVKTATITFDTADGEEVTKLTVDAGTEISSSDLPLVVRDHYRFRGWLNSAGVQVADTFIADEDMTLTAHWLGETVFVYLHNNEDAPYKMFKYGDALTKEKLAVKYGQQDPVRAGFIFGGWYTDEACTVPFEYGSTLTGNLDLYPKWEAIPCTVSFDSTGGSEVETQTVNGGERAVETETPAKDGYVFDGWFTDQACTEAYDFSDEVTENVELYAKWEEAITITLNTTGGELTGSNTLNIAKGTSVGVLPVPRRELSGIETPSADDGYVFAGWYTQDGTKVNADSKFSEDTTLVAYWARNGEVCFVTYISGGEMLDYDIVRTGDKLTRPADPTRTGYTFTGWYTDEACTKAYDFNTAVTTDFNLYAGWKEADNSGKQDESGKQSNKKLPGTGDSSALAVAAIAAAGLTAAAAGITKRRHS